jgi:hypothetical protein
MAVKANRKLAQLLKNARRKVYMLPDTASNQITWGVSFQIETSENYELLEVERSNYIRQAYFKSRHYLEMI